MNPVELGVAMQIADFEGRNAKPWKEGSISASRAHAHRQFSSSVSIIRRGEKSKQCVGSEQVLNIGLQMQRLKVGVMALIGGGCSRSEIAEELFVMLPQHSFQGKIVQFSVFHVLVARWKSDCLLLKAYKYENLNKCIL